MLNQYAVDDPSLPVNQCFSHPIQFLVDLLSRSIGMPSRKDTHGISGNVFANPAASSSAPYPQELNPWSSRISEPIHSSQSGKSESQTPVQDQRCQSGPSAKSSVIFSGGGSSKNFGADPATTADLRSSFRQILHASNICLAGR